MEKRTIRIRINAASVQPASIHDEATRRAPWIWRGNALRIELGVFAGSDPASMLGVSSISLWLRASQTDTSALLHAVEPAPETLPSAAAWTAGTAATAAWELTDADCNIPLGGEPRITCWGVISAILDDGSTRTLAAGPISIEEDNDAAADPPPEYPGAAITIDQADARYEPLGGGGGTTDVGAAIEAAPAVTSPAGTEKVGLSVAGVLKHATLTTIKTWILNGLSIAWGSVTGKPETFTPSAHTHVSADVTDATSAPTVTSDYSGKLLTPESGTLYAKRFTVSGATGFNGTYQLSGVTSSRRKWILFPTSAAYLEYYTAGSGSYYWFILKADGNSGFRSVTNTSDPTSITDWEVYGAVTGTPVVALTTVSNAILSLLTPLSGGTLGRIFFARTRNPDGTLDPGADASACTEITTPEDADILVAASSADITASEPRPWTRKITWANLCSAVWTWIQTQFASGRAIILTGTSAQARAAIDIGANVSSGCLLGDSTIAAYSGTNGVDAYLLSPADAQAGSTVTNKAVPGNTIAQQEAVWTADANKATYDWIVVQIGLNDLNPAESAATALARYQTLVNTINADKKSSASVILATMTPCKARLINLYGAIDGLTAYAKWQTMNTAIAGGSGAITGVSYRVTNHTRMMDEGAGNLASVYDIGDGIHENNAARELIATEWIKTINRAGYLNQGTLTQKSELWQSNGTATRLKSGTLQVGAGSSTNAGFLFGPSSISGYSNLWVTGITPSSANYSFGSNTNDSIVNAPSASGKIYLCAGGTIRATMDGSSGNITLASTTQSTSKDTGSIVTEGGLGVEKDVFTGGKITSVANHEVTTAGGGIILKSPDGTRYLVSVANGGMLSITAA